MAVPLIVKRTSVPGRAPTVDNIDLGQIAFNTYDGKVYIKRSQSGTDSIIEVTGAIRSFNGISGEAIDVTTDDIPEGGSNLYFHDYLARSSLSAGTGIAYDIVDGIVSLDATTSLVPEGSNLYYTDARARAAISGGTGINYDNTTGVITLDTATVRGSISAGTGIAYNSTTGVVSLDATTSLVPEGSNLYYTDARARAAISGGTGIGYNSTTGVITLDTATVRSAISAGTGISYNSTTGVVSLNANTDLVTEGSTNLYYTNARARGAISGGTGISYDSATGVITCTVSTANFVTFTGTETVSNKTLTSTTLQSVKEAIVVIGSSGTSKTINLTNGSFQIATLTGNCTFTMPTLEAGKYFTLLLKTGTGGFTATFTSVKFPNSTSPTITPSANRADLIAFVCDGTYWYGNFVQNYSI